MNKFPKTAALVAQNSLPLFGFQKMRGNTRQQGCVITVDHRTEAV